MSSISLPAQAQLRFANRAQLNVLERVSTEFNLPLRSEVLVFDNRVCNANMDGRTQESII
jgi:hypothetical protein